MSTPAPPSPAVERPAAWRGLALGLLASVVLLVPAWWIMNEPTGTTCTSVSGGVVSDCTDAPTPLETGGLPALLWASAPGLLVLAALAVTPFPRVRTAARAIVAGLLLVGGLIPVLGPLSALLLLAGALMVASAVSAHQAR